MPTAGIDSSAASSASFTATPAAIEQAAALGLPQPVRQAERVCAAANKTAEGDSARTSPASRRPSSPATERKRKAHVCPGNASKNAAAGRDTNRVHLRAKAISRPPLPPCARAADTAGTTAAASP